jgi:hypothetical protein
MQKDILRRFKEFDVITILYALVSGIILLFASFKLDNIQTRLLIRIAIIAIIVFIAFFLDNKKNRALRIIRNFYFLPVILYFISEGDYINNIFFPDLDRYMANFELTIFSEHPGVAMSKALHFKWFSELMSISYLMYYLIFVYFFVRIYRKNRDQFAYVSFVVNMIIYMTFIIFILCPVAGPQYYLVPPDNQIPDGYIFRDLARWIFLKTDLPASALPSLSSLLLCVICYLAFRNLKPLFKVILPLSILILIASVYLKLHYAVDVFAGLLSFPALYWISSRTFYWVNNFLNGNINSWEDFMYSIPRMYGKH